MNANSQRAAVWCGLAFGGLFFIACWPIGGLLLPPSPTLTGPELMEKYADSINWVKAAMPLGLIAAIFAVPWNAVLALQMARIEGKMPVWSVSCFGAGCTNVVIFSLPFIFWSGAFYRVDRDPALFQLINDITWLEFVMTFPPLCMQMCATAFIGLSDKSENPVFPRWACYLNLWVAFLFLPGGLAIFFQTGPFAWNGVLALWVPAVVFGIYFSSMTPVLLKAIKRQEQEQAAYV